MLHRTTHIKGSSYATGNLLRQMRNNNRTTVIGLGAGFQVICCMTKVNRRCLKNFDPQVMRKKISLWEMSHNTASFPQLLLPKQAGISSTPLCESIVTPYCQSEPIHNPLLQTASSALPCSSLLSLALPFSAQSQIGGWGTFCGPNKRAKVVRTPLYESVGRGGSDPNS